MIAIIDYGLGNLGSISNMLKVIGERSLITSSTEEIIHSDGIILPGVGAFDAGMGKLNETGLSETVRKYSESGRPILGICLGMQLLGRRSEEGNLDGLGLIPFECVRFRFDNAQLKIPHMGWDLVDIRQVHPVVDGLAGRQRFYFVHSFHAVCDSSENVLMTCYYGYPFEAAVFRGNCIGVQFHPEKSHDFGLSFLTNFVRICRKG